MISLLNQLYYFRNYIYCFYVIALKITCFDTLCYSNFFCFCGSSDCFFHGYCNTFMMVNITSFGVASGFKHGGTNK